MLAPTRTGDGAFLGGASPNPQPLRSHRTVVGLGVSPVASGLDGDEDENATVHDRPTPIVAIPAFSHAMHVRADAPSLATIDAIASAPRGESFHSVPVFPEESSIRAAESNIHKIQGGVISDALAPIRQDESGHRAVLDLTVDAVDSFRPPPLPQPSPRRRILSRVLFVTICATVLTIAASALSVATRRPWLDPLPHLRKACDAATREIRTLSKI